MSKLLPLFLALVLTGCGAHPTSPAVSQLRAQQAARQAAPLDRQIATALAKDFPGTSIAVHDIGEAAPGTFGFQAEVVSRNRATQTHLLGEFDLPGQNLRILDQQTETR
jgi:uncharacterized lipoprotein YmbA